MVEANLKGEIPKESVIAVDVFQKKVDSDKDASIRVYIHNLRKKLDSYYQHEGEHDNYKITLSKGSYKLEVKPSSSRKKDQISKGILLASLIWLVGIIILVLFLSGEKTSDEYLIEENEPVWGNILLDNHETQIILGDAYFFRGDHQNDKFIMRKPDVNSHEDFVKFKLQSEFPGNMFRWNNSYLSKMTVWSAAEMIPMFVRNNKSYNLLLGSDTRWEDVQEEPSIFFGPFKHHGITDRILTACHFSYDSKNNVLTFENLRSKEKADFKPKNGGNKYAKTDYAMVVKLNGKESNNMIFFLSTHDIGTISIAKLFLNHQKRQALIKELNIQPNDNFELLFEVKGFDRTEFKNKLVTWNIW